MTTFIYTLSDSTGVRYIGKSDTPDQRYRGHLKDAKRNKFRKDKWIKSLLAKGEKPILEILDEVPKDNWKLFEMYWIDQFKAWNFDLVNGSNGGEGSDGFIGKKHSEETKLKLAEKARNQKHLLVSEERKKKLSEAHKRYNTETYRLKISNALKEHWKNKKITREEAAARGAS